MNKTEAYPLMDGRYSLIGNTYPYRQAIKEAGGVWNPTHGWWLVEKEVAQRFAPLLVWCQVDTKCHEGIVGNWVPESWAVPGTKVRTSCGLCDSFGITGEVVSADRSYTLTY